MDDRFFSTLLAQSETITQAADAIQAPSWWDQWGGPIYGLGFVLAIFVLPFILGQILAKMLRMPNAATRIGVVLAVIIGSALFVATGKLQYGIDMKGGTTLVYDIVDPYKSQPKSQEGEQQARDVQQIDAGALATALTERIDPSGTREITIRPRGTGQIEITVPTDDEFELRRIKRSITDAGVLEFRVVANTRDHGDVIALAQQQAAEHRTDVTDAEGNAVGRWYLVGREETLVKGVRPLRTPVLGDIIRDSATGQILDVPQLDPGKDHALENWLKSQNIENVDVLMALHFVKKPYAEVFGDDLASAQSETSNLGSPVVGFRLTGPGAGKMLELTTAIMPDGNFKRRMAIIMDKRVLSAPQVNQPISSGGIIEGRFSREEISYLVNILRSGRLPATLEPIPASETRVGAALGEITIQKGTRATIAALIVTVICIVTYYLFAGLVATFALLLNGLIIFAVVILIRQPLSLPGLAGLILTLGMSVDANVLIYERMREEKANGAAPRFTIRNGFDRAFSAIFDSNLTTIITAIVLYWIGTDQIKGFAIMLIVGVGGSFFTAIYCSRLIFDIAEKTKTLNLTMLDLFGSLKRSLFGERDLDFMSYAKVAASASLTLIVVGLAAAFYRGSGLLNIDFTGGTTVTLQLQEAVQIDELRTLLAEKILRDEDGNPIEFSLVRVEKDPKDTVYTLLTAIGNQDDLAKQLHHGLAQSNLANLVTYQAQVIPLTSDSSSLRRGKDRMRFVSLTPSGLQEEPAVQADDPAVESESSPADSSTPDSNTAESSAETETNNEVATTEQTPLRDRVPPAEEAESNEESTPAPPPTVFSQFRLELSGSEEIDMTTGDVRNMARRSPDKLKEDLVNAAKASGIALDPSRIQLSPHPRPKDWSEDQLTEASAWDIRLPLDEADATNVMNQVKGDIEQTPLWLSLSQIGSRAAGEMQQRALAAILLSLVFIVAYIWFRFQRISYGLAAVLALLHDVLITLGVLALCHWLVKPLGFLLIEDFKIGLTEVAAFLTIIGYSLNDTIVVFDRVREIRGRSPRLTAEMLNKAVNQTLSRTFLTGGTTILTIILLYVFGGEGIHAFSFTLLVGIIVGTYSTIYIAAPLLLWLSDREAKATART